MSLLTHITGVIETGSASLVPSSFVISITHAGGLLKQDNSSNLQFRTTMISIRRRNLDSSRLNRKVGIIGSELFSALLDFYLSNLTMSFGSTFPDVIELTHIFFTSVFVVTSVFTSLNVCMYQLYKFQAVLTRFHEEILLKVYITEKQETVTRLKSK